jgi:ABC-type antimicrobial peptide transport system permease subunit
VATIGSYGVISYSVAQRVPEIGVRIALGAEKSDIFGWSLDRDFAWTWPASQLVGQQPCFWMRVLSSSNDQPTCVAVSLMLIGVAVLAYYLPARRATRVDPIALRYE